MFVRKLRTNLGGCVEALDVELDAKIFKVRFETDHGQGGSVGLDVLDDSHVHIVIHLTNRTTASLGVDSRRDESHAALSFNHIQDSLSRGQLLGKNALHARPEVLRCC